MSASSKADHAETVKRLQSESDELRREWADAKAALGRERDALAELRRESEAQLASRLEESQRASKENAAAREEAAKLGAQLDTVKQLNESLQLQLREKYVAAATEGASSGGGLADELAAARRAVTLGEELLAAEQEHSKQYRLLAEGAEQERDAQLKLTADFKAASDAKLKAAEDSRSRAAQQTAAAQAAEAELRGDLEKLRSELAAAKLVADGVADSTREAAVQKEAASAAHAAALQAVQLELAAARENESRASERYRAELLNHSQDMQALADAKEAQAAAEKLADSLGVQNAELSAELASARSSHEERATTTGSQLEQLEQRVANAAAENKLLHKQLAQLTSSAGAAGTSGGAAGGTTGAPGGDETSAELLSVLRRDKELLVRKNDLLNLEVSRGTEQLQAAQRQLQLAQGRLAELEDASKREGASATHEMQVSQVRAAHRNSWRSVRVLSPRDAPATRRLVSPAIPCRGRRRASSIFCATRTS